MSAGYLADLKGIEEKLAVLAMEKPTAEQFKRLQNDYEISLQLIGQQDVELLKLQVKLQDYCSLKDKIADLEEKLKGAESTTVFLKSENRYLNEAMNKLEVAYKDALGRGGASTVPQKVGVATMSNEEFNEKVDKVFAEVSKKWAEEKKGVASTVPQKVGVATVPQKVGVATMSNEEFNEKVDKVFAEVSKKWAEEKKGVASTVPQKVGVATVPQKVGVATMSNEEFNEKVDKVFAEVSKKWAEEKRGVASVIELDDDEFLKKIDKDYDTMTKNCPERMIFGAGAPASNDVIGTEECTQKVGVATVTLEKSGPPAVPRDYWDDEEFCVTRHNMATVTQEKGGAEESVGDWWRKDGITSPSEDSDDSDSSFLYLQ